MPCAYKCSNVSRKLPDVVIVICFNNSKYVVITIAEAIAEMDVTLVTVVPVIAVEISRYVHARCS